MKRRENKLTRKPAVRSDQDGHLATMVEDTGGKVLKLSPTMATAMRDTESNTLWVLANSSIHGPLVASMKKAEKYVDKISTAEIAQIEEGASKF